MTPQKDIFKIVGLVAVVAIAGIFIYKSSSNRGLEQAGKAYNPTTKTQISIEPSAFKNASCGSAQYYVDGKCYDASSVLSNSKNTYDNTGATHNAIVSYMISNLPKNATNQQMEDSVLAYMKSAGMTADKAFVEKIIQQLNASKTNPSASFSSGVKKYYDKMTAIKSASVAETFSQIARIESEIMSDRSLTAAEKGALLESTSVARYSNLGWAGTNPTPELKLKLWQVDMLGGLLGGLLGPGGAVISAAIASGGFWLGEHSS